MEKLTQEDRRMLSDGLAAVLGKAGTRGSSVGGYPRSDDATWRALAELGIMSLQIPEDLGGLGLGYREIGPVMRGLGQFVAVEPYLATIVLGGGALRHSADDEVLKEVAGQLASGDLKLALAYAEPGSRHQLSHVETRAAKDGDSYLLTGSKSVVLGAPEADKVIVSARTSGGTTDIEGISLFILDRSMSGMTIGEYFLIDGRVAADVRLDGVRVDAACLIGDSGAGHAVLERTVDEAAIASCHESLGAMEKLNQITLEYSRERVAFGQPISKYQAVQHRLVDMHVGFEHASAITAVATETLSQDGGCRREDISAAKFAVGREAKLIGEAAVQLHGAGGTTEEIDVGRYFKRLLVNMMLFGDADHHLQRFMDMRLPARKVSP